VARVVRHDLDVPDAREPQPDPLSKDRRLLTREQTAAFNALVAPLERASGRRLLGRGRAAALFAFAHHETGFRECVRRAETAIGWDDRVGLLCRMLFEREHVEAEQLAEELPTAAVCPVCEVGGGRHAADCTAATGQAT
jgi:hypothetical protein